ncbi:dTDP-4-dehydro-6-deoxyglucose aminotransferase [Streptomyces roseirectus]|uniref:dTDP-4-dehydro-6-deoxyglucose aminotransferase n=1 Tax=Streptomyces roseirectus TaxID=2768066 RepID=A0A7H0IDC8_9ACTN|nr:dTDP-4-dehydro-6-deoxyglucose aminotransferase [Streptomyces roseirectus]QNP70794.1 dTDP-4-dehydro-6-deoxyglucose aminotransferase [Streptomyces roseirectus]
MKRNIGDLAVFGGSSAFLQPLYVGRPNIGDRTRFFDRVNWALDHQWLTNGGPLAREFEGRVAELAGVRYCVSTCNATVALQLLARATDLTGEIIMPSLTFAATAHAFRWLGLTPVFCDIDPVTGCLDPALVEAAITPQTSAIVPVHLWGRPSAVDQLAKVAAEHGVKLLYDASHGLGCTSDGRPIGGFGQAEVFSFHATKVVNAFEGGAVVTDDEELAKRIRSMHNFGFNQGRVSTEAGTNGKMTEAAAAMGLTSLDAFDETVRHNEANYEIYRSELAGVAGLKVVEFDRAERNNFHYLIVEVDAAVTGLHRDLLGDVLRAENVVCQRYFSPGVHEMEPYRSERPVTLPHTERLAQKVLALPTGPTVSREDIRRVCDVVRLSVQRGHEVTRRADDRAKTMAGAQGKGK